MKALFVILPVLSRRLAPGVSLYVGMLIHRTLNDTALPTTRPKLATLPVIKLGRCVVNVTVLSVPLTTSLKQKSPILVIFIVC